MKLHHITFLSSMLFICMLISCNPDRQEVKDKKLIEDYLHDNNLQADKADSGLYYIIHVPGNNEHPTPSDNVHIAYSGSLLNGDVFDSNTSATFLLGNLIEGMIEGIALLGKGGQATFIIPSELGYGGLSHPGIPSNSVIIFEVTLLDF